MVRAFILMFFFAFVEIEFSAKAFLISGSNKDDKINLTSSDQKKLEKAEKEAQKSKQTMQEADKLYAEVASKQAELTVEETEQRNNKALGKQIEALKILQSSNKIKYDVYIAKADEFWKKYKGTPEEMGYAKSLENNARIGFQSSQDQYKEAEGNNDKLIAYSTMTSASELSNKAVDDIKKAFEIYSNTSLSGSTTSQPVIQTIQQPADTVKSVSDTIKQTPAITSYANNSTSASNIYQAVKVNENMVDRFNKFIKEAYPKDYEKYIIDFSSLNYSDIEMLKDAWYRYLYGEENLAETASSDTTKKAATDTTLSSSVTGTALMAQTTEENVSKTNQIVSKKESEAETKDKMVAQKSKKEKKLRRKAEDYLQHETSETEVVKGFTYSVQIVACRVPMNSDMLKLIYNGTEQPEENYENEWYKYSIGPFSTFALARQFRDNSGIKGAFVVAFLNGKKINANEDLISHDQNSNSFTNFNIPEDLIFKVQVAACRSEVPLEELRIIYNKPEQLESSFEEGWYKYLINCGNDYGKACELLKNIGIAGAFIAIYRNNVRISLK